MKDIVDASLTNTKYSGEFPRCDSLVVSNLTVSLCIFAGVTAIDGRPERGRSDTLACPCSDDANRFAQWLTVLLSTAMSL
jgi:hypothetical protein